MGIFNTLSELGSSVIKLIHSTAIQADKATKRNLSKMSDSEVLDLYDKQPQNKYVIEEKSKRGI